MKTAMHISATVKEKRTRRFLGVLLSFAIGFGCMPENGTSSRERSPEQMIKFIPGSATSQISVSYIENNDDATCESLGYDIGFTVDSNGRGTHNYYLYQSDTETGYDLEYDSARDYVFSVTVTSDSGLSLSWGIPFLYSSTKEAVPVDVAAVIIKGEAGALWYRYDPHIQGDAYLFPPLNPRGQRLEISQFSFCLNLALKISQTIEATNDRTYGWDISKTVSETDLTLFPGQTHKLEYKVDVTKQPPTDTLNVKGVVNVENPWPFDAMVTSVESILLDTYTTPLDCSVGDATVGWPKGVNETVTLGMNERMVCEYARNFTPEEEIELFEIELKDVVSTTTVVTASSSTVEGAAVNIRKPVRISEFNTCVRVEDSMPTVSVLADEFCESDRITYSLTYTAADCGSTDVLENTATLFSCDTPFTLQDTAVVNVSVAPCR